MKAIEKELDRLVQESSKNHRCAICGRKADCFHHIIGRANPMTRYDDVNLFPVCFFCHRLIHDGKINEWDYLTPNRKELLIELRKMSYKDFLIFVAQQTEDEYLKGLKEYWKNICTNL